MLTATALLSSGWAVSLVVGIISAKFTALVLGPAGVGHVGLLQSTLGLAVIAATFTGISAGLVPAIGRARAESDLDRETAVCLAVWTLWLIFAGVAFTLLFAFRGPIGRLLLGDATHGHAVAILAIAVVLTLATSIQSNLLAARRHVGDLARLGISNSVLGPAVLLPLIWFWGEPAIPWGLLGGSIAAFAVSAYLVYRRPAVSGPTRFGRVSFRRVIAAARDLLRFGIPFNASALAGTGVQLTIPIIVLHVLGANEVGWFRAAAGLSTVYLGFLAASMGQDYYPRIAACDDDRENLSGVLNQQTRVVLLLTGPLILAMLALAPYLVRLVYSNEFSPAVPLLEWQLSADLFRVAGWASAFAILGRQYSMTHLSTEAICGALLLASSWIGVRVLALEGLGLALFATSVVGFFTYVTVTRVVLGVALARENWLLLAAFVGGAATIRVMSYSGSEAVRIGGSIVVVAAALLMAFRSLQTDAGAAGWPALSTRFLRNSS
jgi:PST family polysaccharide transporter